MIINFDHFFVCFWIVCSISSAVQNRNCRILQLLVAIPGTFSKQDAESSLLLATRKGYADCVKVFLDSQMNPDMKEPSAKTLLMIASEHGYADVVQLLVQAKSEVNMRYRSGETALHFAAMRGKDECISILVQGGADINAIDGEGNTPLLDAAKDCRHTHKALKQLVKSGCKLNIQDQQLRTALHYTSYKAMGTELLLSAGAQPDIQDIDENAPIHLAAIEGFDTIVCCLLTYNCNPNLVNKWGKMAVHYLAMKGHWQAIENIAQANGDLNHPDHTGNIPLWYAVHHNRKEAVLVLLKSNCCPDPPKRAPDSETEMGNPLQTALEKKYYDIAKQLLLAGCHIGPLRQVLANYIQHQRDIAEQREERATLFMEGVVEEVDEAEVSAMHWFDDWVRHPHTLCQLCRVQLLCYIRSMVLHSNCLLHLPQALKDYVMLHELGE